MIHTKGKIKRIIERKSKGREPFKIIILENEEPLFLWDLKLLENIEVGDEVEIEYEDTKYPRIIGIKLRE
jgi:hypothetical protein